MGKLVAKLAEEHQPECRVIDKSMEVFWNMWQEPSGIKRLMLLNTDWTTHGNRKTVTVAVPGMSFETDVIERIPKIFTVTENAVIETPAEIHVEVINSDCIRLYGSSPAEITIRRKNGVIETYMIDFNDETSRDLAI